MAGLCHEVQVHEVQALCKLEVKTQGSKKFCPEHLPALTPDSWGTSFHFLWLLTEQLEYITSAFRTPHALSHSDDFHNRNFRHRSIHSVIHFSYKTFIEVFCDLICFKPNFSPFHPLLLCLKQNKCPRIIWYSSVINHNPQWITFKSRLEFHEKVQL